ncbi:MAG: DUF1549 and DUF1553 domain-containing protein, partial [Planctomycetota bacterium]|nr:DUF1549 and DUF1553 domain-containing protein [Planctomycetota bacterium]
WPYRDWVINAMNADLSFDQFTIEQLAGDLIPNATLQQKIATGFHRLTTCNVEAGVDPEENRVNQIVDRVNTTGTVWLGTTFECMQCHNHKYDPFTQREYYEIFAFFNNTPLEVKNSGNDITYEFFGPKMDLPLSKEKEAQAKLIKAEIIALENQLANLRKQLLIGFDEWRIALRAKQTAPEQWVPLTVISFQSKGGAKHQILRDQSVLLTGKNPDKDYYELVVETDLPQVNGFKFETLCHPSLPNNGPGRHLEGGRANFVVHEIVAKDLGQGGQPVKLIEPIADFSQKNFSVAGLVDGNPETGWAIAPKFGVDHWFSVLTETKIRNSKGKTTIQFSFDQHYGNGRNIGRLRVLALVGERRQGDLPKALRQLLEKPSVNAQQQAKLEEFYLAGRPEFSEISKRVGDARKKLKLITPTTTLVMVESEKRMTNVFKRGNFLDRGEAVTTGTPAALHSWEKKPGQNRLDFAKWIVDSNNPLTARVVVNRWWAEIFGQGIVVTGEDFGRQGEPPTHPKLLDWLAVELVESGWSKKALLKSIVMSSTYRQSSSVDRVNYLKDPKNRFLSRGPRFRMSAEAIRDHFLVVSGNFSSRMGGPPVYPPQPDGIWRHVGRNAPKYNTSKGTDRYRRGIYIFWRRSAPYPSFVNFDAPDRAACVVNRGITNTPLQALTLLNDQALSELHLSLAEKLQVSKLPLRDRLADVFTSCTMREPTAVEIGFLESLWNSRLQVYRQDPGKANAVVGNRPEAVSIAAWLSIVQVLFNLDESITKD